MPIKKTTKKKTSIVSKIAAAFIPPDRGATWAGAAKIFTAVGLFLVPIVVAPWSGDAWELHKLLVLVITVFGGWVCLAVALLRRGEDRWHWHPIDLMVLLFVAVVTISTITSVNWWSSLFGVPGWNSHSLLATWAMVGLYFLVARMFAKPSDRRLVWAIMLIGLAVSLTAQVFQLADLSFLPDPLNTGRWFSTIGNLNLHVTTIAGIFGAALLVLWSNNHERWTKLLLTSGVLISWLVLLFSGRALGWAIFALGMVIVVLHQSREEKKINLRLIIAAVAIAALGLVAQLSNVASHSGLPGLQELTMAQGPTVETTLTTLQHRLVLGTGPSTWYEAFVKYRPESFNNSAVWDLRFTQGGNAWAQLLTTVGLVGGLLFLGLLGLGIIMAWRGWRNSGDPFLLITAAARVALRLLN
jgi:O-antigen ligase